MNRCWYRSTVDCSDAVDWEKFANFYDITEKPFVLKPEAVYKVNGLVDYTDTRKQGHFLRIDPGLILNQQWLEDIKRHGITPSRLRVFSRLGGVPIHVDGRRSVAALNWVVEGTADTQRWYDIALEKFDVVDAEKKSFTVNNNLHVVDQTVIDQPTIVRIDTPHDVAQQHESYRLCFSLIISNQEESWLAAVQRLRPIIKD